MADIRGGENACSGDRLDGGGEVAVCAFDFLLLVLFMLVIKKKRERQEFRIAFKKLFYLAQNYSNSRWTI